MRREFFFECSRCGYRWSLYFDCTVWIPGLSACSWTCSHCGKHRVMAYRSQRAGPNDA